MDKIVDKSEQKIDTGIWNYLEDKYHLKISPDIKAFIEVNSGGNPVKDMIDTQNGLHEVRKILSLTEDNPYYSIKKYADEFLTSTKGKIIPVAVDSGGNYFCVHNDTGKVYFWFEEDGLYYPVANNLTEFCEMFRRN